MRSGGIFTRSIFCRRQHHRPAEALSSGVDNLTFAGEPGNRSLLVECGYPPKSLSRNGSSITYFKQSDQIEDFLTMIGAPVAAMNIMSAKLEKDLRNSVNRRLNCDSANLDKAVEAAQEQLEAIRRLQGVRPVGTITGQAAGDSGPAP